MENDITHLPGAEGPKPEEPVEHIDADPEMLRSAVVSAAQHLQDLRLAQKAASLGIPTPPRLMD